MTASGKGAVPSGSGAGAAHAASPPSAVTAISVLGRCLIQCPFAFERGPGLRTRRIKSLGATFWHFNNISGRAKVPLGGAVIAALWQRLSVGQQFRLILLRNPRPEPVGGGSHATAYDKVHIRGRGAGACCSIIASSQRPSKSATLRTPLDHLAIWVLLIDANTLLVWTSERPKASARSCWR